MPRCASTYVAITANPDVAESSVPPAPNAANADRRSNTVGVPVGPGRERNTLWMIAGIALVLVSGLAAATVAQSMSNRVEVLVAARTIAEGEVIDVGDLRSSSLAVDGGVRAIAPTELDTLIGKVATGPIGEGAIVHPSQFIDGNEAEQPTVIVGAALEAGQYPLAGLRPGDQVKVIEVSGPNAVFDDSGSGPRELTEGEIVEVVRLARSDALLVSIRVNEAIATPLSERAQQGRLRLALIDGGLLDDQVAPLEPGDPADPGEPTELDS